MGKGSGGGGVWIVSFLDYVSIQSWMDAIFP